MYNDCRPHVSANCRRLYTSYIILLCAPPAVVTRLARTTTTTTTTANRNYYSNAIISLLLLLLHRGVITVCRSITRAPPWRIFSTGFGAQRLRSPVVSVTMSPQTSGKRWTVHVTRAHNTARSRIKVSGCDCTGPSWLLREKRKIVMNLLSSTPACYDLNEIIAIIIRMSWINQIRCPMNDFIIFCNARTICRIVIFDVFVLLHNRIFIMYYHKPLRIKNT